MKLLLTPTKKRGVFTAQIEGKPAVVAFTARDRQNEKAVHGSVTVTAGHVRAAKALANQKDAGCYVAVAVSVKGKFAQAFGPVAHALQAGWLTSKYTPRRVGGAALLSTAWPDAWLDGVGRKGWTG